MSDNDITVLRAITPVEVVQQSNPLIKLLIAKTSEKLQRRWPHIDQPWPKDGIFNPDVIQTIRVLVSTYKAEQKKGKKGERRKVKREVELSILQLFDIEGQKLIQATKEEREKSLKEIEENTKSTQKLMAEINLPFSQLTPVQNLPPYEQKVEFEDVCLQLPVLNQDGNYHIKDDNDGVIEVGQAETTTKLVPSSKSKKKTSTLKVRNRRMGKQQDQETLRQLNQIKLGESRRKEEKQAVVMQSQQPSDQPAIQMQPKQAEPQLLQPSLVIPVTSYPQSVYNRVQSWRERGRGTFGRGRGRSFNLNLQQFSEGCYNCGQFGHFARNCNRSRGVRGQPSGSRGPANPFMGKEQGF